MIVFGKSPPIFALILACLALAACNSGMAAGSGAPEVAPTAKVAKTDRLKDKRITWHFSEPVVSGRFANGDPWVIAPVTIVSIKPAFSGTRHGWEVNPSSPVDQGFDSRIYNFNPGLVPKLPYTAAANQSLVKAESAGSCNIPCLKSVSVLTVLAAEPPNGGAETFRPSYFGNDKVLHSTADLRIELLPNLKPTFSAPRFSEVARNYSQVQLDHKANWTGREMHPMDSMPDYGAAIATRNAEAALALMMKGNTGQKRQAVVNYVNYGLDVYYQNKGGVAWNGGGGHGEGRKLPAVMAAVLLNDTVMQTDLRNAAREDFGETSGATFSAAAGTALWGQFDGEYDYWDQLVTGVGSKTQRDPYKKIDGGNLLDGINGNYQFCCTTKPWEAIVAALRLMPALAAPMNAKDLDIYVQRWRERGFHTQPDSCAPSTGSMKDYGVLFGPDGAGGCIPDTDPSDGIGRFPGMHGKHAEEGYYGSKFASELWATYLD